MSNQTTALSPAGKATEPSANMADSFANLFEASITAGDFGKEGEIVKGTVVAVHRDNVIIDIGGKSEGIIALAEFADAQGQATVKAGDEVDVYIESRENDDGLVTLSKEKADKMKVWDEISAACERDELIEGTISQRVKGRPLRQDPRRREGLSARLAGRSPAHPQPGQAHRADLPIQGHQVQQEARQHRALPGASFSRRNATSKKTKTLETLEEGKVVKGVIKNITEYGAAFVDLGAGSTACFTSRT